MGKGGLFNIFAVHPLTAAATSAQLPLTPLTLSQQHLPNHRNGSGGGGGGRQSDGEGGEEADGFLLEDHTVTTGGINREHYELREGSQIVL